MKLSRPAAVFAAVVLLAGGVGVAVNAATTTQAVKLCSNNKTGAVSVPGSGNTCPRGTTGFSVGSDADILALAQRVDRAENAIDVLSARLNVVEPGTLDVEASVTEGGETYWVEGTGLEPGSLVYAHFSHEYGPGSPVMDTVDDFGVTAFTYYTDCTYTEIYFTATAADGTTIYSVTNHKGVDCP